MPKPLFGACGRNLKVIQEMKINMNKEFDSITITHSCTGKMCVNVIRSYSCKQAFM